MKSEKFTLGSGVYTSHDVAGILGLDRKKISYWFRTYTKDKLESMSGYRYYHELGKNQIAVNFFSLIEIYTFYQLRQKGISAQKILQAHKAMGDKLRTPYPFATATVLKDGGRILFSNEPGTLATADDRAQYEMYDLIIPYCEKISFGKDNLAQRFFPLGKDKSVVVDPSHQFGAPVIDGTNILIDTVVDLHKAGDSIQIISKMFDISPAKVKDAISFGKAA